MNKAFPKQTEQAQPKPKSTRRKPVSLFSYRLKIVAGMAAALIMLMLIPLGAGNGIYGNGIYDDNGIYDNGMDDMTYRQKRMEDMEQEYLKSGNGSLNSILNEGARRLNREINSWFNFG